MVSLLKKIGRISFKIVIGILLFLFFVIYVVIPLAGPWAIRSQGSKILAHPVKVRAVWFNPFLLRLSIDGFGILGSDKKEVWAGFDKFWVDASFRQLFKKKYRIESIGLSAPVVNVVLLPGNKINLMELVPLQAQAAAQDKKDAGGKAQKTAPKAGPGQPSALPDIKIDTFKLTQGTVTFTDRTLTPPFVARLHDIALTVSPISTDPNNVTNAVFSTMIGEKGQISSETNIRPLAQPLDLESTCSLNDYALAVLTPYVGKYTGHSVRTGKMDLRMDYRISNNQLNARHKLLIQKFEFGDSVESKDALHLPFGLAIALLEDPQGRISISLPVKGDMSDPKFEYWHLVGQVVTNFFMKLVTSPFMSLISMAGGDSGTEEMGTVSFEPGKPDLTDKTREKLALFVKVLKERPKLFVEVNGSYDPGQDWKAIKTAAYTADFESRRKQSTRSDFRIIKDMYVLSFGLMDFWDLAKKFTSNKKIDEARMQEEMKRLIIEEGKPDKKALASLADSRARAVYDFIIAGGFDAARLRIGDNRETQASMGQIPLEFTITVYEAGK